MKHTFVDGAAYGETETRVQSVAHVCKVLMGKQFEQHGRYAGYTGLIVGLVPFASACPLGFVEGTHVTHDVGLNQVCQVVAQIA